MSLPTEGQSLSANQISSTYLNLRLRYITTSGYKKQTSAMLELYFQFRSRPFRRNTRVILHSAAEFRPNRSIHCQNMMSYRFSRWRPPAMLYLLWSNGGPPVTHEVTFVVWTRSSNSLFVGLIVPKILRFIYFGVLAWNCLFSPLFGKFWGHIFAI